jgi:dihydroorotate dehydrogenase (NAD+) catalytic subunit
MLKTPFYDPEKTYEQNYKDGPFGDFMDGKVFKDKDKDKPQYSFLGNRVFLPFGIAAGPLLNGNYIKAALDKGFDIATYKTVRTKLYPANEWPNVLAVDIKGDLSLERAERGVVGMSMSSEPMAITNSFGVPSYDPDVWQPDLAGSVKYAGEGQVVVGSFQGTVNAGGSVRDYVNDFVKAGRMVRETGVKILEVNLSCPNEGSANLLCFDLERTREVVYAIKNEIGNMPLIIKIAYFADDEKLKNLVKLVGKSVDAIEAINTIPAKIYDENGKQALGDGEDRLWAGICGRPIKWAGVDSVKRLKRFREELDMKFAIIGVGGVMGKNDYVDYVDAGADAVMSVTGAMWNPNLAQEIKSEF